MTTQDNKKGHFILNLGGVRATGSSMSEALETLAAVVKDVEQRQADDQLIRKAANELLGLVKVIDKEYGWTFDDSVTETMREIADRAAVTLGRTTLTQYEHRISDQRLKTLRVKELLHV